MNVWAPPVDACAASTARPMPAAAPRRTARFLSTLPEPMIVFIVIFPTECPLMTSLKIAPLNAPAKAYTIHPYVANRSNASVRLNSRCAWSGRVQHECVGEILQRRGREATVSLRELHGVGPNAHRPGHRLKI